MSIRALGTVRLALLTVAALASLRNLPLMAVEGLAGVSFYLIAALIFFLPTTLVCAALASRWPLAGGLYRWVSLAFGARWGFLTIWLSWLITLAFLPSVLAYLAGIVGVLFFPVYVETPWFMVLVMCLILWGVTCLNYYGAIIATWFSTFALVIGTLLPGLLIIAGGVYAVMAGWPLHIDLLHGNWMPVWSWEQLVILVGCMLAFEGAELSSFHAESVHHPRRTYPRALALAAVILLIFSIFGSLSIAMVLPADEISLVHGIMQSLTTFFVAMGFPIGKHLLGGAILLGGLAGLCTWIGGPISGVLASARDGFLPSRFQKRNNQEAPVPLLNLQAVIITGLIILGHSALPNIEHFYWISTVLAAQCAFLSYIILFAAAVVLKWRFPEKAECYSIPGGKFGMVMVAGIGAVGCIFGFALGFTPPNFLLQAPGQYAWLLIVGLVGLITPAVWLCYRYQPSSESV